ncbi:uncharacterized protein LOC116415050 isoform X3 [Apis florea]|uniref:uncharacterized protein LOC116415050 isoform X3 n=1 Tax=Apis florea TaxID=7463 RepID=UPI0012FF0469|nr:uncharacterized protein LOC116415050 isoform X3 [Apis florea]
MLGKITTKQHDVTTRTTRAENRGGRIIATEEPESINPRKSGSHFKRFLRPNPSENYPRRPGQTRPTLTRDEEHSLSILSS